jgi:hypothetical protein
MEENVWTPGEFGWCIESTRDAKAASHAGSWKKDWWD